MRDIECVGTLAASATHDLQNALAVIRESAGLMQDILHLAGDALPRGERMKALLATISDQVARGGELALCLNSLAHAWEEENGDLGRVIDEFVVLAARGGRMRGVTLEAGEHAAVRSPLTGISLRRALLNTVSACADAGQGYRLRLTATRFNSEAGVLFELVCADDDGLPQSTLQAIETRPVQLLGPVGNTVRFFLPCSDVNTPAP